MSETETKPEPEPAFVAETLEWCNSVRSAKGLPPLERLPKGKQGDPKSCPCGKVTGYSVTVRLYREIEPGSEYHSLPKSVTEFVLAFDAGYLPQYDLDPTL